MKLLNFNAMCTEHDVFLKNTQIYKVYSPSSSFLQKYSALPTA